MDMDLLIELAVKAVKAYLEKEGSVPPSVAEDPQKTALILTENHCDQVCSFEKNDSELCKVTCALKENYEVDVDCFDTVVLYDMTNSNLFKIANGCTDSKFSALAAEAILKGKRVLMVKEQVEILKYQDTAPKAIYNNIYKNLQVLLDSGVTLVNEDDVQAAICEGAAAAKGKPAKAETSAAEKSAGSEPVYEIKKRVVTERDIREAMAQHFRKIKLPERPVITSLARDTARDLGIELI